MSQCRSNLALRRRNGRAARPREALGLEHLVELLAAHPALLQDEIVNPLARGKRVARDFGGARVAEDRREGGDQGGGFVEQAARALRVGGDALHAALVQRDAAGGEVLQALEKAVSDDGLESVELQLPGLS